MVHVWDIVALWVDAEIPLTDSVKCQFTVFCCGSVKYQYMQGGFLLTPTRSSGEAIWQHNSSPNGKCNMLLHARQGWGHSIQAGALNPALLLD